ncbi:calcium-binding protein, partial [Sphingomonas sp.]|uniref:beta strand repeat-containing protein n=1 Tax=Sphingomonas sp. TaxID=28214 RepID=UPI0025D58FB5
MADFEGGSGNDTFVGTADPEKINGNGGNDTLSGAGGNDVISGGAGADTINGGDGDDILFSQNPDPNAYPFISYRAASTDFGTEVDTLIGGNGDDYIVAGYGDNVDGGAQGSFGNRLYISFQGATSGVNADFRLLWTQPSITIGGGVITNIQEIGYLEGSNYDDLLVPIDTYYPTGANVYGRGGNDHIIADYYSGWAGGSLYGGDGNDVIDARPAGYAPASYGDAGDDTIYGGIGVAYGGDGNDTINGGSMTFGGAGNDTINAEISFYGPVHYGNGGDDTLNGSAGQETMAGGSGADTLYGNDGNDVLYSGVPDDATSIDPTAQSAADAGLDHDRLFGGAGDDHLSIGYGDDADGGSGTNTLTLSLLGAGAGVTLNVGTLLGAGTTLGGGMITNIQAVDIVWGSAFADVITMPDQAFTAVVHGGAGNDQISGGTTALTIYGDDGDDTLIGTTGNDTIDGGAGNDTITGGAGLDVIHGGAGYDTINIGDGDFVAGEVYDAGADGGRLVVTASTLVDLSTATVTSFTDLSGGNLKMTAAQFLQFNTITGSTITLTDGGTITGHVRIADLSNTVINLAAISTVFNAVYSLGLPGDGALTINGNIGNDTIYATDLNDTVNGGDGNDTLYGLGGFDYLSGGMGNDVLDGGAGVDDMTGGLGDDTYYIDTANDVIHENAGEGFDTEIGAVAFVLADNVEHGILSGTNAVNLFGNGGDNWLTGNDGANTLYGLGGNDRLEGGAGADTLIGGTGDDTYVWDGIDTIVENAGEGNDTVESAITASLAAFANVENLTLTGNAAINGTGDANANVIRGNSAANTLDGGAGADLMYGGAGDDTYVVDNAGDKVFENANEGTDTVRSSVSFTLGANVENLVLTGTGNINGTGNAGQNTITGNAGSNQLDGGGGGDTLQGGAGNDVYYVRNAGDV